MSEVSTGQIHCKQ